MVDTRLALAYALLKSGQLIVIPTETVYGLAADASNNAALEKIFALKKRPIDHPLIVHVHAQSDLTRLASAVPSLAKRLCEHFWPGPLTLVLNARKNISPLITGGQNSIALRAPRQVLLERLLKHFENGLCAPSANRFQQLSPTTALHVYSAFGKNTPFILDAGPCVVGIESTIVDLTLNKPRILRQGMITQDMLENAGNCQFTQDTEKRPRVSGQHAKHYAPIQPIYLLTREALLKALKREPNAAVLWCGQAAQHTHRYIVLPCDAKSYAEGLYAALHELDQCHASHLYVEKPPFAHADWLGIHDRLQRASHKE